MIFSYISAVLRRDPAHLNSNSTHLKKENPFTQGVVGNSTDNHHMLALRLLVLTQYQDLMKMACLPIVERQIHAYNQRNRTCQYTNSIPTYH